MSQSGDNKFVLKQIPITFALKHTKWRGGREAEGTALEKRHPLTGIVGSNPTLSAR